MKGKLDRIEYTTAITTTNAQKIRNVDPPHRNQRQARSQY